MIALVTGGSGGLGSSICRRLAQDGYKIVIGCRERLAVAEELAEEARAAGAHSMALSFDVADRAATADAVEATVSNFGGLDCLVLAAAHNVNGLLAELPPAEIERMHAVNVMGVTNCVSSALPYLMSSERGRIVLFSSVLASRGLPGVGGYASTKGAIEALTRNMAVELGSKNITVNAVAPGMIDAGLGKPSVEIAGRGIRKIVPLRRPGTAPEVASTVAFLLSDDAGYISGTVLPVDGGLSTSARTMIDPTDPGRNAP